MLAAGASLALVGLSPGLDESPAALAEFYGRRGRVLAAAVAGGLALSLFVVFLGALRAALRRGEGEAGALSAIATIAGSVYAGLALVEAALRGAIGLDAGRADSLHEPAVLVGVLSGFTLAPLAAAAAAAGRETGIWPRLWLLGAAVAAVQLAAGFSVASSGLFSPDGPVALTARAGFAAWVLAVSVALARGRPVR